MDRDKLFWDDECARVWGAVSEFNTKKDFEATVKEAYKDFNDMDCEVSNIKIDTCISTEKGLEPETVNIMRLTDISIENYYVADVDGME